MSVIGHAPSTMTRVTIFLILYGVLVVTIDFMPP